MAMKISHDAAQWYIRELELNQGDHLRFFGKVYGPHGGFSIALNKQDPDKILFSEIVDGIIFYVEEFDEWFFNDKDLNISMREDGYEPIYEFIVKD